MKTFSLALSLIVIALTTTAQAQTSAGVFDSRQALQAQQAQLARVVAIRPVQIKNTGRNTGTIVGATVGGTSGYALTRNAHSGSARVLGTVIGGALGGAVGQTVINAHGNHSAVQIFVQVEGSRPGSPLIGVVEDDDQGLQTGEQVLLVRSRGAYSVVPASGEVTP